MADITYADLTTPFTEDEQLASLLALATLAGFPVTSWQPGSVPLTQLQVQAKSDAAFSELIALVAQGGILEDATGAWLEILARNVYRLVRKPAVIAQGTIRLTCAASAGPYTVGVNQLWVSDIAGHRFNNVTGGTLPSGGTVDLLWQAESPGGAWNVGAGTLTYLQTALPGVTANNPLVSWNTLGGADVETDSQLVQRCEDRWPDIGSGATAAAYRLWAQSVSANVRRVLVLEANNLGAMAGGHVTVYVAGSAGALTSDEVIPINAYIQARRPLCVTVHVASGVNNPIAVTGTLYVKAGYGATALAAAQNNLSSFENQIDIAGTVYRDGLIEVLMAVPGALRVPLTAPTGDVVQSGAQLAKFVPTIAIVEV